MKIKSELQDNYEKLLLSKDTLDDDNNILKEKLVNNENELIRLNELLNKKAEEDAKNKQSINLLMNQVGMCHSYPCLSHHHYYHYCSFYHHHYYHHYSYHHHYNHHYHYYSYYSYHYYSYH